MASATLVKASAIKIGDEITTPNGAERVTHTYTSGKFVHITTTTSGKKTYNRNDLIAKING